MFWQKNKNGKGIFRLICLLFCFCICNALIIFPKLKANGESKRYPAVEGKGECVMELNSRRILYANGSDQRLPMASTTKIATAITVLENCKNLEQEIIIPDQAVGIEGSSVYLKKGEKRTIKELLYGLMLRSGNDCATALAIHCSGSISKFSLKMNETAQKAGALNTRFENPHGLPCKNHYTTAYDLSLITCYAMHNKIFREIVATKYYEPANWKNKNKILNFDGGIGVKTGYTKEAGRCLVSAVEKNGMTLICTQLNCPTTYERSLNLINDAFDLYENVCLIEKGQKFIIKDGAKEIFCCSNISFSYPLLKEEKDLIDIKLIAKKDQNNKKISNQIVGEFQIYLSKRLLFSGILYKL